MDCPFYQRQECRSCTELPTPYPQQLMLKQERVQHLLPQIDPSVWERPHPSKTVGMRNKAKLVVGGTIRDPQLGILNGGGVKDLTGCPLYDAQMQRYLQGLKALLKALQIPPYDISRRRGELKNLLVTQSPQGQFMLRFVLRSRRYLGQLRAAVPAITRLLPQTLVMSANILPSHVALLEGEDEVLLSAQTHLPMQLGEVKLYLQPGGFFQTNSEVATALYTQARTWAAAGAPKGELLDLFCGVGGFALFLAPFYQRVRGIEISAAAIAAAKNGARANALENVIFEVANAQTWTQSAAVKEVETVVLNPPRRGIGRAVQEWVARIAPQQIIYSSCNPATMATDLQALCDYTPQRARLFDMFPHTDHAEVLCLLTRRH